MTTDVCSAIGLDREDIGGKLVAVIENHGSNGNFLISSMMAERLQRGCGVCLVALHNTFGHYHNVSTKLSHNLNQLQEKGVVDVLELQKCVKHLFCSDSQELGLLSRDTESPLAQNLFLSICSKVKQIKEKVGQVCLIIDDLSDIFSLGASVKDTHFLLHYCRTLIIDTSTSIVILSHLIEEDEAQQFLATDLAHVADITITVSGFRTGRCNDITGALKISHKSSNTTEQWNKQNNYLFKLQDKQVKMFAPGTSAI